MAETSESHSRKLLRRLRDTLAEPGDGQARLDRITSLIAESMGTEVCSIYLFRDERTLELCATTGLRAEAVHKTRLRVGEGLVGRVARVGRPINTADAPAEPGFRYMPETGEEAYSSFLGVPIQRLGQTLGVLVVQTREPRHFSDDEVYGLEVVAMVLAEMAELGAFVSGEGGPGDLHAHHVVLHGTGVQEGVAEGHVWLHEPRVVVTNPVAEDPDAEIERLRAGLEKLRLSVDRMLAEASDHGDREQLEILEAYRMFATSRGWIQRLEADIRSGLSAEAAVEKQQSKARARLEEVKDPYLRERLHDLDDLSNRLLRILTDQGSDTGAEMPVDPILVARNIGPGELLDYGRQLRGIILEEGSVGSHAAIVARALAIPLVIHVPDITSHALNGDHVIVDGETGVVHLRPDDQLTAAFRDRMAMEAEAQKRYASLRDQPARTRDGHVIALYMNAGLMADLPSLESSGAEGVGLFRTELQFLTRSTVPKRSELAATYARVMKAAGDKPVIFRTLDIGSDKVLPYLKRNDEPNPAMGWRAIRVGLDRPRILAMQVQALVRAAEGRAVRLMFPFVATLDEFEAARAIALDAVEAEVSRGRPRPRELEIGIMLETPSLAHAPDRLFELADFVSIGGNDLKQFFFAADRENERVRRRYDTLDFAFLDFLSAIIRRCEAAGTPLSFCGEDAGRPLEAAALAAIGLRRLSLRPASIGPVKSVLRQVSLARLQEAMAAARSRGETSARRALGQEIREAMREAVQA